MEKPIEFYHENHIGAVLTVPEVGSKSLKVKDWQKYHSRNTKQTHYAPGKNHSLVLDYDIAVLDLDLKFVFNPIIREDIKQKFLTAPLYKDTFTVETGSGGLHFYFRISKTLFTDRKSVV